MAWACRQVQQNLRHAGVWAPMHMVEMDRRLGHTLSNSNSHCATDERLHTTDSSHYMPKQAHIGLPWFKAGGMKAHSILGSAQAVWLHLLSEYRYAGLFLAHNYPSCCFRRKGGSQTHHHLDTLWTQKTGTALGRQGNSAHSASAITKQSMLAVATSSEGLAHTALGLGIKGTCITPWRSLTP